MWNNDEYVANPTEIEKPTVRKFHRTIPTSAPAVVGVALLVLELLLEGGKFIESIISYALLIIIAFLFTTTGVLVIVRKESPRPGMNSITGWGAIITGLVATLVFGFVGVFLIIGLINFIVK